MDTMCIVYIHTWEKAEICTKELHGGVIGIRKTVTINRTAAIPSILSTIDSNRSVPNVQ